jgi:hypothetical protein
VASETTGIATECPMSVAHNSNDAAAENLEPVILRIRNLADSVVVVDASMITVEILRTYIMKDSLYQLHHPMASCTRLPLNYVSPIVFSSSIVA